MTIAVFGGTGKTGRLVVAQALAAGHKVRVLARDPDKIAPAFGLEFVKGDVLDGGRVMATAMGCQAVIVVLGAVKGGPADVCSRGTELILQAAAKAGAKKIVVMTSLGVGDSRTEVPWVFRVIAGLFLREVMADKEVQEDLVRASSLDWTLVRASGLLDEAAAGTVLSGPGRMADADWGGKRPRGQVSRSDVASFLLTTLDAPGYSRSTWFISG